MPLTPLKPVQLDSTYHLGLPAASYVYHAPKMFAPRCVKWIPQPDSLAFHQRPVNAPGAAGAGAVARLALHCTAPGIVTALW